MLTSNVPETVIDTGQNSTVSRVCHLDNVRWTSSSRECDSDTQNETAPDELWHGSGSGLDTGAKDDGGSTNPHAPSTPPFVSGRARSKRADNVANGVDSKNEAGP